eukprot:Sdes_comp19148_c0_seq3m9891
MLVLLIGDLHIPHRANDLPLKFKKLLVPGKIQHVLCTGNLTSRATFEYLKSLAQDVHVVCGDFDEISSSEAQMGKFGPFPSTKIIELGSFRFGLLHGHQIVPWNDVEALSMFQRQTDVDVIVSGHTHQLNVFERDGKLYINPGSATGAYSTIFS